VNLSSNAAAVAAEHGSDGIISFDTEGRAVYVNRRAELLLRRRGAEMVGLLVWDLLPDVRNTASEAELRRAMAERVPVRFEHFYPSLYAWHEMRAFPTDEGFVLLLREITDRVRMLQDEAVQEGVRNVLVQAPIAISITRGPEHRFEITNEMFRRLVGGRDVEGRTVRNAFPELEGQGFFEILDRVYQTGVPFEGSEMPARFDRYGDGTLHDGCFNVIYHPLRDVTGNVSGVMSLSVEVTELVSQRKAMERAAAERTSILDQIAEGVVITDAEGRITFVNEAATRLHGVAKLDLGPGEYAGEYGLLTEEGAPHPPEELPLARAVLRDEAVAGARWRIRRPDGTEILVEGNARPVIGADGEKIAAVLTLRAVDDVGAPA